MGEYHQDFEAALAGDELARQTFSWLAPSHRHDFVVWIEAAVAERDRLTRIQAAMDILAGREAVRRN
ncbi:YdeI/OmpD-associated family protein [Aquidulcibacter sp.]|uniref:YdeI/OmpD-associated family protein n=1 Tax=Aquidulcibacter sp. TaxID=2052990 RepID=UPI0025C6F8B9|nr:YdeI/OmpD-associated family protein [Aquidulcibacter sp.]MCA3693933.1 YdeI/OmpD-associated family protein [Aquidulcibacter sp.]